MNSGEYYSRQTNYTNWGYDKYYGLLDINDYKDKSYTLEALPEVIKYFKDRGYVFKNFYEIFNQ